MTSDTLVKVRIKGYSVTRHGLKREIRHTHVQKNCVTSVCDEGQKGIVYGNQEPVYATYEFQCQYWSTWWSSNVPLEYLEYLLQWTNPENGRKSSVNTKTLSIDLLSGKKLQKAICGAHVFNLLKLEEMRRKAQTMPTMPRYINVDFFFKLCAIQYLFQTSHMIDS